MSIGDIANKSIQQLAHESMIKSGTDAHEILPNLWLGSSPGNSLNPKYKYTFNFVGRPTYHIMIGQQVIVAPFDDSSWMPADEFLHDMAEQVIKKMEHGEPILLHCAAGINRSALIMALVLIKLDWEPHRAIAHLRNTRSPMVLSNQTFESWLLKQ